MQKPGGHQPKLGGTSLRIAPLVPTPICPLYNYSGIYIDACRIVAIGY